MPAVNTLPPPVAPGPLVQHDGPLMQLSGKGLLAPGSWKRRFAVLDQRRLYFYQLKEDNQGYREKTSHYVDLQDYDICEEAKSVKTASNVLVISSSEIEKSFFDTGRLYLSAETATEMNEWISQIRTAMTTLRDGRKPTRSSKSLPADSATNNENKVAVTTSEHPGLVSAISLVSSSEHLDCITKQRAKGPTGRRLPRQAKSRLVFPLTDAVHQQQQQQQQQRSESLPRLEQTDPVNNIRRKSNKLSTGAHQHHNRSFDAGQPSKRTTVYAYSSSDESLNLSFAAQPTSQQDDETVETLCELPLSSIHHSTSTPSLAVGGHHWLSVGSSSSTPRPLSGKRRSGQPYSVVAVGSTSTDDPPGLQHQYQLLLQETAAIKTTLSGLEADFGASRRDMGWLQENLTTVQSAASGVSDKVIKMQSQVANMERQICGAVKEAQQLQQRANDALKSASDAERDFRRLENECQSLLSQLRQQQQEEQSDDPLCLSPMTPHPPGLMMSFQQTDTTGHFSTSQQQRSSKLPPLAPVPQLNVPPTFDFAALLTTSQGSPTRIKSSFRSESLNKSQSKSISFGPTTTYATSPTTDPDDDLIVPVATSTLRKSSHNNIVLFNQNQQHSIIQLANSKMMT